MRTLKESESESLSVMCDSLQSHGLYSPWNSAGQNTGVGSHSLLQGIFPIQGSNPGLPHCRRIVYQPSHKGSPRILEWVAYPFSSRSSWPRNPSSVSCTAGGFLTNWAVREAHTTWGHDFNVFSPPWFPCSILPRLCCPCCASLFSLLSFLWPLPGFPSNLCTTH